MKTIYKFILLILIASTSCNDDFLELTPQDRYSDAAVWQDPALTTAFANNIYTDLYHGFTNIMLAACTDEAMEVWGWETNQITLGNISPSYLAIFDNNHWHRNFDALKWDFLFQNVRACNIFLGEIDDVPFDDLTEKDQIKGEVLFLRAFVYHQLTFLYGGVPVYDKALETGDELLTPRDSFKDCIDFIVKDCDDAAALLSGTDPARATKGAALALKSRVLLWAASDLYHSNASWAGGYSHPELIGYVGGDQNAMWQQAKDAAKAVIDIGVYSLYGANPATPEVATQNYTDIFLTVGHSEDIFIHYYDVINDISWDVPDPGKFNGPNGYHNWGGNTPLGQLVDAYKMIDGSKFDWNNPAHKADPYANRDPRFYASILHEGAKWRTRPDDVVAADPQGIIQVGFWEQADGSWLPGLDTRQSPIEDWNGTYTGYYLKKFIDPAVDHQYNIQKHPFRLLRYAEVLLNYAEACIELGQEAEAITTLNIIRKRAGMPDIAGESGQDLVDSYRNERCIELAYELQRFFDIRRWMIGTETHTNATGVDVRYYDSSPTVAVYTVIEVQDRAWQDKLYFLPIYHDEMNRNEKLVQNPLY